MKLFKIWMPQERMQTATELQSWSVTWYIKTGWADNTKRQAKTFIDHKEAQEFEKQLREQAKFIGCWISTKLEEN